VAGKTGRVIWHYRYVNPKESNLITAWQYEYKKALKNRSCQITNTCSKYYDKHRRKGLGR